MRIVLDEPAKLVTKRTQVGVALGYPLPGIVYRNGDNVTGKLAPVPVCQYLPEITVSDDGTVAAFYVDDITAARLPAQLAAVVVDANDLPAKINDVLARRDVPPDVPVQTKSLRSVTT